MEGRRCVSDGLYDLVAINKGLDELGMLSSISPIRRDYMQDRVLHGIEKLSMVSEDPGHAQQQQPHLAAQQGSHSSWGYNSNNSMGGSSRNSSDCVPHKAQQSSTHIATSNFLSPSCASASTSHATEKENDNLAGFQVLTMNSTFITSFKAGYELPCHVIKEPANIRVYKCSLGKRRRLRTHPYDNKNNSCNTTVIPTTSSESGEASGSSSSGYRLRTTSLSSGTSRKKSSPVINGSKLGRGKETLAGNKLIKSRSLENISAAVDSVEALNLSGPSNLSGVLNLSGPSNLCGPSKTQELETVFQGIQQLKMDDHT